MKTINIKHLTKIGLFLAMFGMTTVSCEDQLKENPYGKYDADNYFDNTNKMEMAVNGIYETFSNISTYGQYWQVYDCDTDLSHVKGAGTGHAARDLGHYNAYVEHSWLQESWQLYYRGIDRANTVLANKDNVVTTSEADEKLLKRLVAQAKCMRAMCFFDLVQLWGDVPMKLTPSKDGDDYKQKQNPRSEVYDQIITDFKEAIPDLWWADDPNQKNERLSKGAALGLLARVYLHRAGYGLYNENGKGVIKRPENYKEYYQAAQSLVNELISSGKHGLLDAENGDEGIRSGYERTFRNMCELTYNPYENICEISFYTPTGNAGGASNMGTYNGPEINDKSSYGRANSFIKTHHFFYNTFEEKDLRKDVAIATFKIGNASDPDKIIAIAEKTSRDWSPGKWRRNWQTAPIKNNNNVDVNVSLLRYSDVLLMSAEIENELNGGPNDIAFERINQVRRRAFGKPYLAPDATIDLGMSDLGSKEAFFEYIMAERARELCFEGGRRQDLIRWNKLEEAIKKTHQQFLSHFNAENGNDYKFAAGERFKSGKHELYPIPSREIRETSGALVQNPGY